MNLFRHRKPFMMNIVLSLLLFFNSLGVTATAEPRIPTEVHDYSSALQELQKQSKKQPMEPVYALGIAAANKLSLILEKLSPTQFHSVKDQMLGFNVNREEIIYVNPDPLFFKNLARQKGQDVDIAFIDLFYQTQPGLWPIYIEHREDYSGCTKYGSGLLVALYGKWQKFQQSFPLAYTIHVRNILDDIERRLTLGTNACGTTSDTINELKLFIKTYPKSEISHELTRRIQDMEEGKSK